MGTRTVRRAGLIAAAALAVPFLAACGSVQEFTVGECLDMSEQGNQVTDVPTVDCDEPHDSEVYHVHTYEDGDFPGDTQLRQDLDEACLNAFEPYVGAPYETSIYYVQTLIPSSDSWDRANDREGICILNTPDGPRSDSARGSGL